MKRARVKSSTLVSAGYNVDYMTLELEFTSGEVYQYFKVPGMIYTELMRTASQGEYFNYYIKDQFLFNKVT